MFRTSGLFLFSWLFLVAAPAQKPLLFENYKMEDGFAHNGTSFNHSIEKDREGFVWFTTYNGLSRFDGENFRNYKHDPDNHNSIPTNMLTVVHEGPSGKLWVATPNDGIYLLDKKTEAFSRFSPITNKQDYTLKGLIMFVQTDDRGRVWYGGDTGVAVWNRKDNYSNNFDGYFDQASAFFQQSDGTIWIYDKKGLHRKKASEHQFQLIVPDKKISSVADMFEPEKGKLWLTSPPPYRLTELDTKTMELRSLKNASWYPTGFSPHRISSGNNGDVWLASAREILRVNLNTGKSHITRHDPDNPLSLPPSVPHDILVDEFDNLFVNTGDYGMAYAHTQDHPFEVIGDFKSMDFITLDDHRLLIRDNKKGGIVYDTKKGAVTNEKIPVGKGSIYGPSMVVRGDTQLWFWSEGSIQYYDLRTKVLKSAPENPNPTLYVRKDRKGRIWNGLSYLDEINNRWENTFPELQACFEEMKSISFSYANQEFDLDNRMFVQVNGHNRVVRYDYEKKSGKSYPVFGTPISGTGDRFHLLSPNGLAYYQAQKDTFFFLTEKDGLKHSSTFATVDDHRGRTWIGTPRGLQGYNWETKSFINIDFEDGFPMDGQTLVHRGDVDSQGNVYFDINIEKIFRFHPDSLKPNTETAPVYFTEFYQNLEAQIVGLAGSILEFSPRYLEKIRLKYDQADFGFGFTMPCFYKSDQIEYFYRLEPYHREWQSNGTRNVLQFTNIRPGNYTLRVKGRTASGIWSTNEASIKIRISPPWWQSWWAYSLYILGALTAIYFIYRFNLKRQVEIQETVRLQELDSLKTRLYTNITHEFRTPLTVIMGVADGLKNSPQERKLIRRNSSNLLRLINQLLDLSKLDSGTMNIDLAQGDVIHYLRYLTESFHSLAVERNIDLQFETDLKELIMDFDEVKVQHIIYNLLSNALKFTPEGGRVRIHTGVREQNGHKKLLVTISDSGIGISKEQLPHIFDRFYQADGSSTRKGEGTGIGLALTHELIRLMKGNIRVESTLGEGTSVHLEMPVQKGQHTPVLKIEQDVLMQPLVNLTAHSPKKENSPLPRHQKSELPQVLLVEDNHDVALYIQGLLKPRYQVGWAQNGQEGIEQALETIPDIIISDVMMPEKDGYDVCSTLKQDIRTSHIPIILLTAKAEQKDKVAGLKFGADAYLMKPFDKEELFVRLDQLLELRKRLRDHYSSKPEPAPKTKEPGIEERFLQELHEKALEIIGNPENAIARLERAMKLSQMQLYRKLKALTGQTPSLYLRSVRLYKAKELLRNTGLTVSEIAYEVGFTDPAYFSRAFSEEFGVSPSESRKTK